MRENGFAGNRYQRLGLGIRKRPQFRSSTSYRDNGFHNLGDLKHLPTSNRCSKIVKLGIVTTIVNSLRVKASI